MLSNFIIGFPTETWEQIRQTFSFAEEIDVDIVNFHIATPLPKTKLMKQCVELGLINEKDRMMGYTKGVITTKEFTPIDLQILRAYEWDRINFSTPEKTKKIASMCNLTMEKLDLWRRQTRRQLGLTMPADNHG